MGVPRFYGKWVKPLGAKITPRSLPTKVSSLSIDMNGLLHQVAQKVYGYGEGDNEKRREEIKATDPRRVEEQFQREVSDELVKMVKKFKPQDLLILAVDGVAPIAKIQQQRQRRYRSAVATGEKVFDTTSISPGTEFMINFDQYFVRWLSENHDQLTTEVIYSSHFVRGEGEHKIMDYYRSGRLDKLTGANLIYGLDADLIMLSLLAPVRDVLLVRDDSRDTNFLDINALRLYLSDRMKTRTAIPDFCLLMSFLGNDFLPHPQSFENREFSIEEMINLYTRLNLSLTIEGDSDIEWNNLTTYLTELIPVQEHLLKEQARARGGPTSRILGRSVVNGKVDFDEFRNNWYSNIFQNRGESNLGFPGPKMSEEDVLHEIDQMSIQYLTGLAWNLLYYMRGTAAIKRDYYYPFLYAPLLEDIVQWSNVVHEEYRAAPDQLEFSPLEQMVAIIPPSSVNLIPKRLHVLYTPLSPIIDLMPQSFEIDLDGKKEEWLGVAIIPLAEPARIIAAVNEVKLYQSVRDKYKEVVPIEIGAENLYRLKAQKSVQRQLRDVKEETKRGQERQVREGVIAGIPQAPRVILSKNAPVFQMSAKKDFPGTALAELKPLETVYTPEDYYIAAISFGPIAFKGQIPPGTNPDTIM